MSYRALLVRAIALIFVANFLAGCTASPDEVEAAQAPSLAGTGELKEFHIWALEGRSFEPLPGKKMGFFAFGLEGEEASVPGPEIRVTEGDRVRVTLHQPHAVPHTIHFHGISLPWAMDGVPFMTQDVLFESSEYVYEFDALETGTYWYHCHVDAPIHVDFGLFGPLIIEPRDKTQDPAFDREATLMLHEFPSTDPLNNAAIMGRDPHDQRLPGGDDAADWAQRQPRGLANVAATLAEGATGVGTPLAVGPREHYPTWSFRYHPYYDTFMINGKSFPETEPVMIKSGETLRIRLINAGQLLHTMHLHGHHFLVTHKDGYKLASPYHADSIVIGPGERYDLYVKGNNPGVWDFHDHGGSWEIGAYASNEHAHPGGMNTMLVYEDFEHPGLPEPSPGTARAGDYLAFAGHGRMRGGATPASPGGAAPMSTHVHGQPATTVADLTKLPVG